jgi:hypothetical protein
VFGQKEESMRTVTRRWIPLLCVIAISSYPLSPQANAVAAEEANNSTAKPSFTMLASLDRPELATFDQEPSSPSKAPKEPFGWHIAAYPVMGWAPIFHTSVTFPPRATNPIVTEATDSSLNGAYFGGARFEGGKWSAEGLFMWASLHGKRKSPTTDVDLDFVFGHGLIGYRVLPGLYAEGGVRRLALTVKATDQAGSVSRSPGFWDPIFGATYRKEFGQKWRILLHGDGGGFGVGSDVDLTGTGRAEWQFVRHCGLAFGYGAMHFSQSSTINRQTVSISPTMHGPIAGLGIFF